MSGSAAPRARGSPKQGPLRATIPLASHTKQGSTLQASDWARRSPGAAPSKEAEAAEPEGAPLRRTGSLDTIYLRGLFPRESPVSWQQDRATQTDLASALSSSLDSLQSAGLEDKFVQISVRQRRRSCDKDAGPSPKARPSMPSPSSSKGAIKSSRSSEEGLNQEIESYILRSEQDLQLMKLENERLQESTPEGRKAPVADLLREPAYARALAQCSRNSSESGSSPETERPISGSSPQINRFSARAPPDGCERVLSKSVPILRPIPLEVKPHVAFTLKPSSHSAFEMLNQPDGSDLEPVSVQNARLSDRDSEESPNVPDDEQKI